MTEEELKALEDRHEAHKAGHGKHVRVKRMHGEDGRHRKHIRKEVRMFHTDGDEDYTIVLVEENVTKGSTSGATRMVLGRQGQHGSLSKPKQRRIYSCIQPRKQGQDFGSGLLDVNGKVVFKDKLGKFSGAYKKRST